MCSGVYMLRETMPLLNMTLSYRTTNEGITKRRYQSHCSAIQSHCLLPFLPACNNSTMRPYHQFIVCPPVVPWRSVTPAERLFELRLSTSLYILLQVSRVDAEFRGTELLFGCPANTVTSNMSVQLQSEVADDAVTWPSCAV